MNKNNRQPNFYAWMAAGVLAIGGMNYALADKVEGSKDSGARENAERTNPAREPMNDEKADLRTTDTVNRDAWTNQAKRPIDPKDVDSSHSIQSTGPTRGQGTPQSE